MLKEQRAEDVKAHDEAVKALDKAFPADSRALVASRLKNFLDETKDVAFEATLVDAGPDGRPKKKVFVDAALEAKSAQWKLCFRAGKPATDAARAFAQKWLTALQAQGIR